MDFGENETARKLMRSFMQFRRAGWHERTIVGYKPSEIKVLFCIKKGAKPGSHGIMVSEISNLLHVTSPTVTQLIKDLEAAGLVERTADEKDRRAVRISLTEKGEKITKLAEADFYASFNGLIEHLGEERSHQLADLLTDVFDYFNEKAGSMNESKWSGDET